MEFQDHRYWLRTYPNCIVGKELVNWLLRNGTISTRLVVVVTQMLYSNFTMVVALSQAFILVLEMFCISGEVFRISQAMRGPAYFSLLK